LAAATALALALPAAVLAANGSQQAGSNPMTANAGTTSATGAKATGSSRSSTISHADRAEQRIRDLHAKLGVTPDQEDEWNAVANVMRENAQQLDALAQARQKDAKNMSALDDVRSYSEIADAHAQGLKKFVPAFEAFYSSLSDSHKQLADQMFHGNTRLAGRASARGG